MKFKITPGDALGASLRSELVSLLGGINSQLNRGLQDLAQQGEAKAKDWAATRLHRTRQQYELALNAVQLGPNKWAIVLDASAAHLEEGYASYDMKKGMLNSTSVVKEGSRRGQPWVRRSKDGYRYAVVPLDQSNTGHGAGMTNPSSEIQITNPVTQGPNGLTRQGGPKAQGQQTAGDLKADMDHMIKRANKVGFKGAPSGTRLVPEKGGPTGNMVMVKPGQTMREALGEGQGFNLGKSMGGRTIDANPLLTGLVKKTWDQKQKNGKVKTMNAYMTFRVVSEKSGGWIHPGFWGARIFPDLEAWADRALSKMVEDILKSA